MLVTLGMDWPLNTVTFGHPCPCKNLLEIEPTAAKVIREDELLPCLVVLYSVFGLVELTGELKCVWRWHYVTFAVCSVHHTTEMIQRAS